MPPPSLCSAQKRFRISLLTQKLKTTWDKSLPACSIIQGENKNELRKKNRFLGFFLKSYKGESPLMPESGEVYQGEARGTSAFQLLLSTVLLKKSKHDLGLLRKSLLTKGF